MKSDFHAVLVLYLEIVMLQARSQPSRCGGGGLNLDGWNTIQARVQDFLKGGGGEDIHKHPPWTLSAWHHPPSKKLKNTPTLGHSQAPPPPWTLSAWHHPPSEKLKNTPTLGQCPCDIIHIPSCVCVGGGGGDRSRSRTLCIGFQYRDKFKVGWSSLSRPIATGGGGARGGGSAPWKNLSPP